MSEPATHDRTHPAVVPCENCGTVLQGVYCHICGQSVHNPIRHVGHAIEEFFEAFWHLDGRLFRTLRDLMSPGRVAINYLAGHRARYIAPLRLFVVLSVLTFFVGAASLHLEEGAVSVSGVEEIGAATSVEEVERIRDGAVAAIAQARDNTRNAPGVDPALVAAEVRIRAAAADRVVELTGRPPAGEDAHAVPASEPPRLRINLFGHSGDWDAQANPLVIGWWPGFANDWLNRKIGNLEKNMQSLDGSDFDAWLQGVMAAAPSALFLLVPVFALLLKVAYLLGGRLYLEHLVVALYSHVFLLLMLLLAFVISALDGWASAGVAGILLDLAFAAVLGWMPVYLLLMQRRVYRQSWWLTGFKYLVVGTIYFAMLAMATLLVFLGRLASP